MSCIEVTITRCGGTIKACASRLGDYSASATRMGDFSVRVGLVCGTSLGERGIIWASDERLITLENGYLIQA